MSDEIRILEQFFAAINRNDLVTAIAFFAPDIVRRSRKAFRPLASTAVLRVAGQPHQRARHWAEGSCDPEGFFQNGDKVVVYLHAHVRLHGATNGRGTLRRRLRGARWETHRYHSFAERGAGDGVGGEPTPANLTGDAATRPVDALRRGHRHGVVGQGPACTSLRHPPTSPDNPEEPG